MYNLVTVTLQRNENPLNDLIDLVQRFGYADNDINIDDNHVTDIIVEFRSERNLHNIVDMLDQLEIEYKLWDS